MTLDLTQIMLSLITGIFAVLTLVIRAHFAASLAVAKDAQATADDMQAAKVLDAALTNALGAMQRASSGLVTALNPVIHIPGVPDELVVGTQYVLNHAGDEADRFGITPAALADKINARLGVKNIEAIISGTIDAPSDVAPAPAGPSAQVISLPLKGTTT